MRCIILAALAIMGTAGCQADKDAHLLAGTAIQKFVTHQTGDPVAGCIVALGVGLSKEAYDRRHNGVVDVDDVLATVGGCGIQYKF